MPCTPHESAAMHRIPYWAARAARGGVGSASLREGGSGVLTGGRDPKRGRIHALSQQPESPALRTSVCDARTRRARMALHDRAGRTWHCMSRGRASQHAVRPSYRKVERGVPQRPDSGRLGHQPLTGDYDAGCPLCSGQGVSGTRDTSRACVGC